MGKYLNWKYEFSKKSGIFNVLPDTKIVKPRTFYKYYALNEHSVDALTNLIIYASHPAQLNDPFDCDINLAKIEDEENAKELWDDLYSKARDSYPNDDAFFCYSTEAFSTLLFRRYGVFSLTDTWKNMIMWSSYAQNNGFCLEFDVKKFPFKNHGPFPIHYVPKIEEISSRQYDVPTIALIQSNVKRDCWSYEHEWRLLVNSPEGFDMKTFGKHSKDYNIFPDLHDRTFKYPLNALKSISLGINFFKDKIDEGTFSKNEYQEILIHYQNECHQTKILDFLDKISCPLFSTEIFLMWKKDFELIRVPIIVRKLKDFSYIIIEN